MIYPSGDWSGSAAFALESNGAQNHRGEIVMHIRASIAGAVLITTAALTVGGIALVSAGDSNGEGHTPVLVCHWVPAAPSGAHSIPGPEGGSYNAVVVDDDASSGNNNLQAHAGHEHDLIGEACAAIGGGDSGGED
jgi:hypothetical protein